MTRRVFASLSILGVAAFGAAQAAQAATATLSFAGAGVSAEIVLTYSGVADAYGGYAITGVSGTFTDTNNDLTSGDPLNIVGATITGLVPVSPVSPLPVEVLAPNFSYYPIANGVPSPPAAFPSPALSYDNTYYPDGSPIVCLDYPAFGGPLDVYGLMFTLDNGYAVDLWSNGSFTPGGAYTWGVAVANPKFTVDYVVSAPAPELSTWAMMGVGFLGLAFASRRARGAASPAI